MKGLLGLKKPSAGTVSFGEELRERDFVACGTEIERLLHVVLHFEEGHFRAVFRAHVIVNGSVFAGLPEELNRINYPEREHYPELQVQVSVHGIGIWHVKESVTGLVHYLKSVDVVDPLHLRDFARKFEAIEYVESRKSEDDLPWHDFEITEHRTVKRVVMRIP